jgi:predicted dehydrogenase
MSRHARVGVIGLGRVAQLHHLPNLAQSPRVEIAAVCDLSHDLATRVADRYALSPGAVAGTAADLLSRDLDAVVVANRNHGPVVRSALDAGLQVFVEKPVCWGLAEGAELVELERKTRPAVVGYMKRYDPAFVRLAEADTQPLLVRVHVFAGARHRYEKLHHRMTGTDSAESGLDDESAAIDDVVAATLGHGAAGHTSAVRTLAELAIHDINLARALLGPLRPESAYRFDTPFGPGFLITMSTDRAPVTFEIVPDFETARDWDETLTLFFRGGATELRFGSPFLRHAPTGTWDHVTDGTDIVRRNVVVSHDSAYRLELEHFIDCALGLAESNTPIQDAVADVELVYEVTRLLKDLRSDDTSTCDTRNEAEMGGGDRGAGPRP